MAIGVEPKEIGIMNRNPRNPKKGILTKATWVIVIFQALLICALTVGLYLIDLLVLKMPLNAAQSVVGTILPQCFHVWATIYQMFHLNRHSLT
jgi:P-type Ca2+ transporter type 2C